MYRMYGQGLWGLLKELKNQGKRYLGALAMMMVIATNMSPGSFSWTNQVIFKITRPVIMIIYMWKTGSFEIKMRLHVPPALLSIQRPRYWAQGTKAYYKSNCKQPLPINTNQHNHVGIYLNTSVVTLSCL